MSDVDWGNHGEAHRAVMRLFPRELDGRPGQARALNGILYRADLLADELIVLVQSWVAPQMLPVTARTMVVPDHAWNFEAGTHIAFRVAVNPIRRRTVRPTDAPTAVTGQRRDRTGEKERVVGTVPVDAMGAWLAEKLASALTGLEVINHFRDGTDSGRHKVVVDTLDCLATVSDPTVFDRVRRDGLGRAKAYACGLLTAQRVVD